MMLATAIFSLSEFRSLYLLLLLVFFNILLGGVLGGAALGLMAILWLMIYLGGVLILFIYVIFVEGSSSFLKGSKGAKNVFPSQPYGKTCAVFLLLKVISTTVFFWSSDTKTSNSLFYLESYLPMSYGGFFFFVWGMIMISFFLILLLGVISPSLFSQKSSEV